MNLRQLEEMVKTLRQKGYSDDTQIYSGVIANDEQELHEIRQVTRVSDEGTDHPAFIIMSSEYSPRRGQGFNTNLALDHSSFPDNFPGPCD